jgi:hypothetical protein
MKIEGNNFIISIGSAGTFNFEIKKTHSSKSKICLMDYDQVEIIKKAIEKFETIRNLNLQIKKELGEELDV